MEVFEQPWDARDQRLEEVALRDRLEDLRSWRSGQCDPVSTGHRHEDGEVRIVRRTPELSIANFETFP